MKLFFAPIFLSSILSFGQNTFEYSDTEFNVGDIHISPPVEYSTCLRLVDENTHHNVIDSLKGFMKSNPYLSIEIGSHTDMRGSEKYNLKLSERRAESIMKELITAGIDSIRLTYRGYGETEPIISNKTIELSTSQEEKEKYYAINRRTEIKITKIKKAPK